MQICLDLRKNNTQKMYDKFGRKTLIIFVLLFDNYPVLNWQHRVHLRDNSSLFNWQHRLTHAHWKRIASRRVATRRVASVRASRRNPT